MFMWNNWARQISSDPLVLLATSRTSNSCSAVEKTIREESAAPPRLFIEEGEEGGKDYLNTWSPGREGEQRFDLWVGWVRSIECTAPTWGIASTNALTRTDYNHRSNCYQRVGVFSVETNLRISLQGAKLDCCCSAFCNKK